MRSLFTLTIFLCLYKLALAQSDFKPGYYITNQGDTVFGLIDNRGYIINATMCTYRANEQADEMQFLPGEISAFRFNNGKYYETRSVDIEGQEKTLFLEFLIDGKVDIFYFKDFDNDHYFVEIEDGRMYELRNEEKEVYVNNTRYIKESEEYKGLLTAVFKESPATMKKINGSSLTHKSLIGLARDYHYDVCEDESCVVFEKKEYQSVPRFGLILGADAYTMHHKGPFSNEEDYMRNNTSNISFNLSFGLFFKTSMPNINEKLFFLYEGLFSKIDLESKGSYVETVGNRQYISTTKLSHNTLNNSIYIRYEYPRGKIQPTFQFGAFMRYHFNREYERTTQVFWSWGGEQSTNTYTENPYSNLEFGPAAGLGMQFDYRKNRQLSLDLKYQYGFGLLDKVYSSSILVNLGVQVF